MDQNLLTRLVSVHECVLLTKLTVESGELRQAEAGVGRSLGGAAAAVQAGIRLTAVRNWRTTAQSLCLIRTDHRIQISAV